MELEELRRIIRQNTQGPIFWPDIIAAIEEFSSKKNNPKPIPDNTFSKEQVIGIWEFANAQLQIINNKKETSENNIEMMCLAFTANAIIDIMDIIADIINSADEKNT